MYKYFYLLILIFTFLLTSCKHEVKTENLKNETKEDTSAIEVLSLKIRETPTNSELFAQRGELYFQENKFEEAINDYQIAHKLDTTKINYYLKLADYQLVLGKSEKVKTILDKGAKNFPENLDIILRLARLHLYVQQYKESAKFVEKALKIDKHRAETYFIKGLISKELGDTARAIDNFLIATQKESEYYESFMMLGLISSERNDNIAIDYYKNAIDIQPISFEANYNLAMFYQENNKLEEANQVYDHILSNVDSLATIVYFNKGYIKLVIENKYEEAIPFFEKAVAIDSTYYEAYHNLGFCYEQLGEFDKAKDLYNIVLELEPNYQLSILGLNRLDEALSNN
jgi:tetratricopeptide (TPR) repeat protein